MFTLTLHPLLYCRPASYSLLDLSFFICIIISLRPAWLARALLSFKRAQSSGNDNADERQETPFEAEGKVMSVISLVSLLSPASVKDKRSWVRVVQCV